MKAKDIQAALPQLSTDELKGIRDRCQALLQIAGSTTAVRTERSPTTDKISLPWDVVRNTIETEFGISLPYYGALGKLGHKTRYKKSAEHLDATIDRLFGNITITQRSALYAKLAVWIVHELHRRQLPVTANTVIHGLTTLDKEIDAKFPGYIQAGLTHWILGSKNG